MFLVMSLEVCKKKGGKGCSFTRQLPHQARSVVILCTTVTSL
jgi:hypothetical protein